LLYHAFLHDNHFTVKFDYMWSILVDSLIRDI